MSEGAGLLDTSTVILLRRVEDATQLPDDAYLSAITLAELSVGPVLAGTAEEAAIRQGHVQFAESAFDAIAFDAAAARAFASVAASLRAKGRKVTARSFDALIAATAIARQMPLYTCNPGDFSGIAGLDVRTVAILSGDQAPDQR
jgi:predicted nucleic acid-binding protein